MSNTQTPADARTAHHHYDAARRTLRHLRKYADAFAFVRGAVPDKRLAAQLAAYAEAVEVIRTTIPRITDPNRN